MAERRPQDWITAALAGFFADEGRDIPDAIKGALAAKLALACVGIQGEVEIPPFTRMLANDTAFDDFLNVPR